MKSVLVALSAFLVPGAFCPLASAEETTAPGTTGPGAPEKTLTLQLADNVEMKLALIPAGTFTMGSPLNESGRGGDEGPQKAVTLTKPFYMGVYEVTQAQYNAIMGKNPSRFKDWAHPVETVSWDDAVEFCKKASHKTGRTVRLPTEAEWEYACRAGSSTRFSFGDDDEQLSRYAWFSERRIRNVQPVGQKAPNAWGLYDMHGNVWEWCNDWYAGYAGYAGAYANPTETDPTGPAAGQYRVLRGGSWRLTPSYCRSACRNRFAPDGRYYYFGFRVVVSGGAD